MKAEETKVLKTIIDIVEDIKDGALPSKTVMLMLEEILPDLLELQRYIEALETDLDISQQELDEAEHNYEELYDDYLMTEALLEAMEED
ncbi:hypothetical protein AM7_052 [Lactococcus phage AM7]|uniref:Uncharacterized protein n=2 Tax=Teubervirus AM6 TaxID=2845190 RepID=A0A1W6JIF1_9CAUD|nr:hypothetical protein H1N71_gp52 [Lactococcus phage AM6]ARM65999.1 hypothetical protein AM6_052 [Lactococcus phage AM6]ARM66089.1 hypothetical protein AM7_052 [Lactococcus phage AM7]